MARTVVIGDVHGCAEELSELVDRVAPTRNDDLVFVGDLVARGPDTPRVLRMVRQLGGRVVLGNHEARLLAHRRALRQGRLGPRLSPAHLSVLAELGDEDVSMLEGMPLKIDLPAHGVRVVHAGVVPGLPWEEQDPNMVLHIRSISEDGEPSKRWGIPWPTHYSGPPHVLFGHNAQRNVQIFPDATGLDTGCVYGGALTALVLDADSPVPPPESRRDVLLSVPARTAYCDYGRPLPSG